MLTSCGNSTSSDTCTDCNDTNNPDGGSGDRDVPDTPNQVSCNTFSNVLEPPDTTQIYSILPATQYQFVMTGDCVKIDVQAMFVINNITDFIQDFMAQSYSVQDPQIAQVGGRNVVKGLKFGQTNIAVSHPSATSPSTINIKIEVGDEQAPINLCGGQIDDINAQNSHDYCLRVTTATTGHYFTATPSEKLMMSIGYRESKGFDTFPNGRTYNSAIIVSNPNEPTPPRSTFVTMDNYFSNEFGGNTQHERWCDELATRNLAGRNNWRRPTVQDFDQLLLNKTNLENFGWYTFLPYATITPGTITDTYFGYFLDQSHHGQSRTFTLDYYSSGLVSCVADP